ncbi:MAG: hypothetical protein BalsKO_12940 [Balneolaceae bacterium]
MKNLLLAGLTFIFVLSISSPVYSNIVLNSGKIIFEISDKFNEVKFGVTENTVYMVFSEKVKEFANLTFGYQHQADLHAFEDSGGNFISGTINNLESNRIEFQKEDISEINFRNGKLNFVYKSKPKIGFEDIYSSNGTKVIENFYVEDLEEFILTFSKK